MAPAEDNAVAPLLGAILSVGESLRTDLRELERRVSAEIRDLRSHAEGDAEAHLKVHAADDADASIWRSDLVETIHAYGLDRAKAQGRWGMVRWVVDLLGRNWKLLATAAVAAATFLGDIRVELVAH